MAKKRQRPATHIVNISGGKDSASTYLLALERRDKRPGFTFTPVFANVGNEHEHTIEFVRKLAERTGGPEIVEVKANLDHKFATKRETIRNKWPKQGISDSTVREALEVMHPTGNPFVDLCLLRAGFPGFSRRFCTHRLKIEPITDYIYGPIWKEGKVVISWQGMRRDESPARATKKTFKWLLNEKTAYGQRGRMLRYLPILDWKIEDVWAMHRKHGLEPNPLYADGMSRVGCMPCYMCGKADLRVMAERYPDHIERIASWERLVTKASKQSVATFFPGAKMPGQEGRDFDSADKESLEKYGIHARARWSKTTHGGKQFDLLPIDDPRIGLAAADFGAACNELGVCE